MPDGDLLRFTANIVSAHLSKNAGPANALADFIRSVYAALSRAGAPPAPAAEVQQPAVPIRKSVFPDHLVCLEDGKKMKMLKRHLQTTYGMTPDDYRAKWHLPSDYPMVAPNYAAHRSALAQKIGLGRKLEPDPAPAIAAPVVEAALAPEVEGVVVQRIPERKRGRRPGSKNRTPDPVDMAAD